MATTTPVTPDTLVAIKINVDGFNRRFKLPLRDLGPLTLHSKLRSLLNIPDDAEVIFERYSDSAADFVTLDPANAQVFKQLYRAAKAKLKLRLKLTVIGTETKAPVTPKPASVEDEVPSTEDTPEKAPEEAVQKAPSPMPAPAPIPAMAANYYNPYGASCYRTPGPVQPQPIPVYLPPTDFPKSNLTLNLKSDQPTKNVPEAAVPEATVPEATVPEATVPEAAAAIPAVQVTTTKCPMSIPAVCSSNPVTFGTIAREKWYAELAALTMDRQNALRSNRMSPVSTRQPTMHRYSVYCNSCKAPIPDEHYHCSTCDEGDYDLCPGCVDVGILCGGDDHWLIKRNVKNGRVVSSTTEKLPPRQIPTNDSKATLVPEEDLLVQEKEIVKPIEEWVRTCNSCLIETKEDSFITCHDCADFDLCIQCYKENKHGHHPKHTFAPATEVATVRMSDQTKRMLEPGRNVRHQAICDGCDKNVYGVRHKCLDCPDWDYCNTCVKSANYIHKGHRFVPIYDPISYPLMTREETHTGIFCDGPLCKNKRSYIQGHRYKCAVCHDTDFCASCEASPNNLHNKTHPVIKIKTPIRSMSITTTGDHGNGRPLPVMGDRIRRCRSTATATAPSSNAATQVQTVAETKPAYKPVVEVKREAEINNWVQGVFNTKPAEKPVQIKEEPKELESVKPAEAPLEIKKEVEITKPELVANFVRDTIADSTILQPGVVFEQTWYLRNDGKTNWPAGCSVKFIGGDNMCATDPEHPASVHELVSAAESTTCYTEVAPGQEHGFTVLMRTPMKQGKVVSYWRLTGPNGEKFGHRLWCDVEVRGKSVEVKEEKVEVKNENPVKAPAVAEKEVEVKEEKIDHSTASSQLSFPKLAKESPEQSVHEAEAAVPEEFEVHDEDFIDFTSVANDAESASDDFLTDEEYDILDASDEDFTSAKK